MISTRTVSLPFSDTARFEDAFRQRLQQLLELPVDQDALGLYILVLANLGLLPELATRMAPALARRHDLLRRKLDELGDSAPADDRAVFLKLERFDPAAPPLAEYRQAGPWLLQYNPMRSLRPARNSSAVIDSLFRPFDEQAFHFDKHFLEREILWRGSLGSSELRLLFNKFPFARYHCLVLIDAARHKPQFLSREDVETLLGVMEAMSALDGLAFTWNSLGAQASVNHQHWQMTLSGRPYPIEAPHWRHNGGRKPYPLEVRVLESSDRLWQAIDQCQQENRAFNLFLRPDRYWLIRRRLQGSYPVPDWAGGLAWSEVCGAFSMGDAEAWQGLDAGTLEGVLRELRF